ncbi:hypothetical protein ATK36_1204 [Amycolatopsis sulphurea]|uniref:Uncharacterized protein n=1 Tax=Amycolatopsis sulphurea TaxID=76022 RepID=A0A2A9G4P8_9PSEU|nr:hypothetical protein ATK36_1204 [Amycolatopsis sulphurea]
MCAASTILIAWSEQGRRSPARPDPAADDGQVGREGQVTVRRPLASGMRLRASGFELPASGFRQSWSRTRDQQRESWLPRHHRRRLPSFVDHARQQAKQRCSRRATTSWCMRRTCLGSVKGPFTDSESVKGPFTDLRGLRPLTPTLPTPCRLRLRALSFRLCGIRLRASGFGLRASGFGLRPGFQHPAQPNPSRPGMSGRPETRDPAPRHPIVRKPRSDAGRDARPLGGPGSGRGRETQPRGSFNHPKTRIRPDPGSSTHPQTRDPAGAAKPSRAEVSTIPKPESGPAREIRPIRKPGIRRGRTRSSEDRDPVRQVRRTGRASTFSRAGSSAVRHAQRDRRCVQPRRRSWAVLRASGRPRSSQPTQRGRPRPDSRTYGRSLHHTTLQGAVGGSAGSGPVAASVLILCAARAS